MRKKCNAVCRMAVRVVILAAVITGSLWHPVTQVKASGIERTGREEFEIHKMSERAFSKFLEKNEEAAEDALENGAEEVKIGGEEIVTFYKESHANATDGRYSIYTTDRVYNTMTSAQKQFYDDLYATCESYLTGNAVLYQSSGSMWLTAPVYARGLSVDGALDVLYFFSYSNPQFYFLSNAISYGSQGGSYYYMLSCYSEFCDGNARAAATNQVFAQANQIIGEANKQSTAYGKLRVAEEMLARKVTYKSNYFDQSCYGALVLNQGVCASYSEAYELICNALGFSTIAVTSLDHEWNEVYVNGSWYVVDVTWDDWDDADGTVDTDYFLKSYATIYSYGDYDAQYHLLEESVWRSISAPPCTKDFVEAANISATPDQTTISAYNGLHQGPDGNWYWYNNGVIDTSYTGMACNEYGWWYVRNGQLDWNYTGMACNEYGWWYYRDGQLDWNYTGMACNEYGWWYYRDGQLDWNYTGMACNEYGWWYYRDGQLDWNYTGMACNEYGWWYYQNGQLDWNYTGMACNEYGWWYYQNGRLDWNYTGMACNEYGWWYYQNGQLDWGYTGFGANEWGTWLYLNGKIAFDYNGWYGDRYIQGGQVL